MRNNYGIATFERYFTECVLNVRSARVRNAFVSSFRCFVVSSFRRFTIVPIEVADLLLGGLHASTYNK